MKMKIRNEKKADYREVEELLRDAFWDLYVPGCVEHYVAHVVREHPDFIPELDQLSGASSIQRPSWWTRKETRRIS